MRKAPETKVKPSLAESIEQKLSQIG